jgi:ABC-2 type transport system permease protein/oleandomycin transport system permease protein
MSLATKAYYQVTDTWAITRRNLLRYVRLPQLLFFSSVQPIMFLILFNYVFGGAIATGVSSGKYIDYFLPGIMVQMILFGAIQTGIGLAEDMSKGIIDRFRSLPMSRAAVMSGRTLSDSIRNVAVSFIMLSVGMLIGFRFHNGFWGAVGMIAIVILFGFAFSWFAALMGLNAKDAETAQLSSFLFIFPLIFASSAYVPVATMPSWLQTFARNQPITQVVNAARQLAQGFVAPGTEGAIWKTLVWIAIILAVFVPLAIWRYRRR